MKKSAVAAVLSVGLACTAEDPSRELADLAADAEARETIVVPGKDGWLFFGPELRHLSVGTFWGSHAARVSRARQPDRADPLPAILDFEKQLDDAGVELILVPVPPKSVVYAEALPISVDTRLDGAHQSFYELLRREGVTVLDLTDLFLENRTHEEGPVYCRQDTHWSGIGAVLAAKAIAGVVREQPWFEGIEKRNFQEEWYSRTIEGDLWRELDDESVPREEIRLRRISGTPDPASPVVLLGDSHNLVFHGGDDMHAEGSGLSDQLAFELGLPVELVAVRGSGATPARVNLLRRAQRDPTYWENKRLVIWCFAAREFTESDGWSLVPISGG